MKLFKLIVHQKNFSGEDLIINPKDFPGIKKGDIVEIYHAEDEFSRLLLQITSFKEDLQGRETISVEQSIASAFQLRTYGDVCMNIVDPDDVALDSVELTFKDQYLGRSDMWRLKNSLVNTCVYLNKKVEFCGGSIRCQVYEMWASGERVACGVITEDTKVVFRSSTSMVYLFIQMSSEMWDFDIHGDLYFEKAVNGFLAELLQKWKKTGSNHEVTIVLFSRTFYKANSLDEFPAHMRECLQQDYKGRFYEDFYRVAVQNERYDDWANSLVALRRLFTIYQEMVLEYHARPGIHIPKAYNSTAAQGNFLEVLNMSLNVFEKHYLDRSFDRTGQLSIVVTPGVGVFEVDRELTNVTKQRVIDNGVGSDLVCVGEQPLHAVPLLKFHNKDTSINAVDDYSMPHWINLSFYSSNKKVGYSNFIPRIKLPPRFSHGISRRTSQAVVNTSTSKLATDEEQTGLPNTLFDYDAYDAKVFQLPAVHSTSRFSNSKKVSTGTMNETHTMVKTPTRRKMSDPDVHHISTSTVCGSVTTRSAAISIPSRSNESSPQASYTAASELKQLARTVQESSTSPPASRAIIGSVGSSSTAAIQAMRVRPGRALINPFDPSHVTIKLTSNRRRWTHIFPKGPTGVLIQQHHYQAVPAKTNTLDSNFDTSENGDSTSHDHSARGSLTNETHVHIHQSRNPGGASGKSTALLWGVTGEQEWTPALTTGVDWKSLTIPACLPITTDYFPDKRSLQNDYLVSDYNLLPDDVNADYAQQRAVYKKPLTAAEVFKEIVSQRLSQGFQLIVQSSAAMASRSTRASSSDPAPTPSTPQATLTGTPSALSRSRARSKDASEPNEEYLLSIGRIFHRIALHGSTITVTRYRPRHPYPPFNIHYRYRFHAPHHSTYEVSWVSFTTEKLENYNWNHLDHYICTRGDTDFAFVETLKYWRFRVYLLPGSHQGTRKILDGSEHFDVYTPQNADEQALLTDGFLRFLETWVNKIKRPNCHKKPRASVVGSSPFRERLGSNRAMERPRSRSGSKVMERVKTEGSTSGRVSPASEVSLDQPSIESTHIESSEESLNNPDFKRLGNNASYQEILEGMKNTNTGLGFLTQHQSLPSYTFSSADAIQWLLTHVEGLTTLNKAAEIMEGMLKEKLIRHASRYPAQQFIVGFYLYYIVDDKEGNTGEGILEDLQSFENEWIEVEVRRPLGWKIDSTTPCPLPVPIFLADELDHKLCGEELCDWKRPLYRHTHLEIDVTTKSDRIEWGHARYQPVYRADRAYELVVQWVAATGALVADLVLGWARKAQACGLHMIPIPADPFALPFSIKSDPLRGPIFIPLDTEVLMGDKSYLFEEFPEDSWNQRLFLLQDAIATKFGFIACILETPPGPPSRQPPSLAGETTATPSLATLSTTSNNSPLHHQYVHLTGNAFVMIPTQPCCQHHGNPEKVSSNHPIGGSNRRYHVHNDPPLSSPHEEYITRHVSGKSKEESGLETRIGFLWSWNHMIGRRWKSASMPATGDEGFQTRMLKNFRAFCANDENRLKNFWDTCWSLKIDRSSIDV